MNKCLQRLTILEDHADDPLKADFRNFLHFIYTDFLLYETCDFVYDVADWMQNLPMSEDGVSRGQVQCQRRAGKSIIVGIFIAWLFYCNPNIKVGVICSTDAFARRMVKFVRGLFDGNELLHHLAPRKAADNPEGNYRKDQTDNETEFICGARTKLDLDPSCKAFGITATFTGTHPDVLIADDIEVPENSGTVLKREKIHEKCREFESLRMDDGLIMFMGTPQTLESLYIKYLDKRYVMRRWPAEYPNLEDVDRCKNVSPMLLRKLADEEDEEAKRGAPTYPERFNSSELAVIEDIEGPTMYSLQFLLDPTLADQERYPLKLANLIVMDTAMDMAPSRVVWGTTMPLAIDHGGMSTDHLYAPVFVGQEYVEYNKTIMVVDPSGSGRDEVAWYILKSTQGLIFVTDGGGIKGDGTSEAVMRTLARHAFDHGVQQVVVEDNFGHGMYTKLLAPEIGKLCRAQVIGVKSVGQKEIRIIDILGPLTRQHRLVLSPRVAADEVLTKQIAQITYERGSLGKDDRVDALAIGCSQFTDMIQVDPEKVDEDRKRRQREDMAKDFEESWHWQKKMGRSISAGRQPSAVLRGEYAPLPQPKIITQRGTRGWGRA